MYADFIKYFHLFCCLFNRDKHLKGRQGSRGGLEKVKKSWSFGRPFGARSAFSFAFLRFFCGFGGARMAFPLRKLGVPAATSMPDFAAIPPLPRNRPPGGVPAAAILSWNLRIASTKALSGFQRIDSRPQLLRETHPTPANDPAGRRLRHFADQSLPAPGRSGISRINPSQPPAAPAFRRAPPPSPI